MFNRSQEQNFISACNAKIAEERQQGIDTNLDVLGSNLLNFIPHVFTGFLADSDQDYDFDFIADYDRLLSLVLDSQVSQGHISQQERQNITQFLGVSVRSGPACR